ncbi:Chromate resistance protein ChrB [Geminocystis sp. GBBB08]|uniref:Chromate resistance protein ChrB n=1 Tax=Geminocystis sp. GBBB08 TaxID=2604140 RepID=UPI0027E2A296|nr:Chromate resistance protein ChrB [Geminocystis sp. GBBB08]MBL1209825.1 ChrB domain-containing protein [Geminocystis sp. GBBB08]
MNQEYWNLLIYRVPSQPSSKRVYVWRKLKGWGGLYLQQSVCIFPVREELPEKLEKLKEEIIASGGEAELLTVKIEDREQNQRLIEQFQQQSEQEYQEFFGRCRDLHQELAEERAKNNFTFAELDENEAELAKLRTWLSKIHNRDLFDASGYASALAKLIACEEDFQIFTQQVFESQETGTEE